MAPNPCIKDTTASFSGYACVFQNTCGYPLKAYCPNSPTANKGGMNINAGGTGDNRLPASGFECLCTGGSVVVSEAPATPAPTMMPTLPTPSPTTKPPTPSPTPIPTATFAGCIEDVTSWFGGAYSCVVRKACQFPLKVTCPGYPGYFWTYSSPTGNLNLPPFGTEVCDGTCTVVKH
jgi:hypothetical protein